MKSDSYLFCPCTFFRDQHKLMDSSYTNMYIFREFLHRLLHTLSQTTNRYTKSSRSCFGFFAISAHSLPSSNSRWMPVCQAQTEYCCTHAQGAWMILGTATGVNTTTLFQITFIAAISIVEGGHTDLETPKAFKLMRGHLGCLMYSMYQSIHCLIIKLYAEVLHILKTGNLVLWDLKDQFS
jgi:hypothetical protein